MIKKIKEFFKKKKEDILYLQEEVKFNNIDDLKSSVDSDKKLKKILKKLNHL
jgi:hypothetical protein